MKLSISIVIPTYNGLELLKHHLPSVVENSQGASITVVDDASTDQTLNWLGQTYPDIKTKKHRQNLGFSQAVNTGFRSCKSDLVLLLNNDVTINQDTIPILANHFQANQKLFAVGALEKLPDGGKRGKSSGMFHRGLLIHQAAPELIAGPTLWVFAASGMFDRKKWQKLKGLDPLYRPAYWEDIDISYRAWKAGYECEFEPKATVEHVGEVSMNQALQGKKAEVAFKNQLLFYWKNITDWPLIFQHFLWLPYHLIWTSIKTRGAFVWGFLQALRQLDQVMRQTTKLSSKRSDQAIIEMSS